MSLDNTITEFERSKLAVWDYPVSDKYTKVATKLNQLEKLEAAKAA